MTLLYLLCLLTVSSVGAYSEVRLRGGSAEWEGRVEVYHDGNWGTICDDGWGLNEAKVVCKQLGYPLATKADRLLLFGKGEGPIWMDEVVCRGDENSLEDCQRNDWGEHDCTHGEDAGVICSEIKEGGVRLLGSPGRFEGRVEVWYNDKWGTICDHGWTDNDADVICRQLGYGKAKTAVVNAYRYFGYATSPYTLEDMRCDGFEDNILDCVPFDDSPEGCDIYDVAGVYCYGSNGDGLSPEAIAGIVLGSLLLLGIILCCVSAAIFSKTKKKRATTSRNDTQNDQMVYHVSNGTTSGFPQGPYSQYPTGPNPPLPPAYYNPTAVDAPPAYAMYQPAGQAAGATANTQAQGAAAGNVPNSTQEHIYKEAL